MGESMIQHNSVELNGIRFHYAESLGEGPTLVLLIGFNDSIETYLPIMPDLATIAHVYAFEFRGHGESGHTPNQYTMQNHVHDVEQFLQTITDTPVILAGHSMGGGVAGWTTARNGEWVKGLIVEDANLLWSDDVDDGSPEFIPVRDQITAFKASGKSFEEFAEQIAQSPASSVYEGKTRLEVYGKEGAYRHARQRWAMDVTHYDSIIDGTVSQGYVASAIVPLIRCPTCFITSNQWTPTKDLQAIPGAVHVTINTADHRVHEVCPTEFTQAVKSFIATI